MTQESMQKSKVFLPAKAVNSQTSLPCTVWPGAREQAVCWHGKTPQGRAGWPFILAFGH